MYTYAYTHIIENAMLLGLLQWGGTHLCTLYTQMYVYIFVCVYDVYTHTKTIIHVHIHMHTHTHTYAYTYTCICIHIHIRMHTHTHTYAYTYTYVCIHIHIHLHTHTSQVIAWPSNCSDSGTHLFTAYTHVYIVCVHNAYTHINTLIYTNIHVCTCVPPH